MAEKKRNKPTSAKEDIINRVYVLYAAFIIVGLLIACRLIQVQVADKNVDKHIAVMERNITRVELKLAHRGAILSRDGKPLAMSNLSYEPIFDFASEGMTKKYKEEAKFLTKLFQALRIELNGEMEALAMALEQSLKLLKPGGRLVIMSYHSLEDRIVKNFMRSGNTEGRIEKDFFGRSTCELKVISRKAIAPSAEEIERNPRSRSAKLRIAEKI